MKDIFVVRRTALLLISDGSVLLTERSQVLKHWVELFRCVFNRHSTISDGDIYRLPQVEISIDLNLPHSLPEAIRTVQQLSSEKTSDSHGIPAEIYKHGSHCLVDHLTAFLQQMRRCGQVSQDFMDSTVTHLYKRRGDRQLWDNRRGISLLKIDGKVFPRILLNCSNGHLEQRPLPESPCAFRRQRPTTVTSFAAGQQQKKCQEMRTHLCTTFVNLRLAFDQVDR
nr:unnamed protein product [Spirometra erinaceieuropaei]